MRASLTVISGPFIGQNIAVSHGKLLIGREVDCHLRPDSSLVSRHHCALLLDDFTLRVRDLGSRNGTLVNGRLVQQEQALAHGDQIQIGPVVFEVRFEGPSAGEPADPLSDSSTFMPGEGDSAVKDPSSGTTAHHPPPWEE